MKHQWNRRTFLAGAVAGGVAPAGLLAAAQSKARISFSTLGCPKWEWKTILTNAAQWGYNGIELRGLLGEMDLTKRPEFQKERLAETMSQLQDKKLRVVGLGSSARMHEADAATRAKQLDEGKRFLDLARQLKAPFVRVFGDKYIQGEAREVTLDRIAESLRTLGNHAAGTGVTVLLESHGDFYQSATLRQLMEKVGMKTVAILWDAHHTCVSGKEKPEDTYRELKPYVRHVHLKDSKTQGEKHAYVLTGEGDVPIRETVRTLVRSGYQGYYNLEWEKAWQPEIAEPEVAFPHFAKTIREYLAAS